MYWNLEHTDPAATSPHTVVVWLAFTDVDDANAALRVLPASHKLELEHADYTGEEQVLGRGVAPPVLEQWIESAETLSLRAGGDQHPRRKRAMLSRFLARCPSR